MKNQTATVPQFPVFKASLALVGLLVLALAAWAVYYVIDERNHSTATADAFETCLRFVELANDNDPKAAEYLGPTPAVPEAAVSTGDADRLVAEFILHKPLKVLKVVPVPPKKGTGQRFKMVLDGPSASERILVQTPTGPEPQQKMLYNADLIVEVKEGKILGVQAMLHED